MWSNATIMLMMMMTMMMIMISPLTCAMAWYPESNWTNKLFSEFTGTNVIFLALCLRATFYHFFYSNGLQLWLWYMCLLFTANIVWYWWMKYFVAINLTVINILMKGGICTHGDNCARKALILNFLFIKQVIRRIEFTNCLPFGNIPFSLECE